MRESPIVPRVTKKKLSILTKSMSTYKKKAVMHKDHRSPVCHTLTGRRSAAYRNSAWYRSARASKSCATMSMRVMK